MKKMLITFFNIKGIAHFEFIPKDQIINQAYFVEILKWLHEAVYRKRPNNLILHHNNAPAHKALSSSLWPKNQLLKLPLIQL
jgi:hypothetical protein